jgi:hypothetical protein
MYRQTLPCAKLDLKITPTRFACFHPLPFVSGLLPPLQLPCGVPLWLYLLIQVKGSFYEFVLGQRYPNINFLC